MAAASDNETSRSAAHDAAEPLLITIITGPTASGKTALALDIAARKNGVIINADAMQMYDALPILTAQPDAQEQAAAPHRLYASRKAGQDVNTAGWRDIAIAEIERATGLGLHPVLVGGTGLYIKTLIDGISPMPQVAPEIRDRMNVRQQEIGQEAFFSELCALDPVMASRLKPQDVQRSVRAREVLEGTGRSLSYWQDLPPVPAPAHWRFEMIAMTPDKPALHARIKARIGKMIDLGALDEVAALAAHIDEGAVPETALIVKAHGFRPFRAALRGEITMEDAVARTDAETRAYAKRQMTWLRNQYPRDHERLRVTERPC